MKYSKQREVIFQTVCKNPIHPTADQVYGMLKTEHPNLSLGTVYRNLNLLAEHGLLRRIPVAGGGDRFDGRLDDHHHMLCLECGQVVDCELPILNEINRHIHQQTGFTVTRQDLFLRGYCKDCTNYKKH